MSPSVLLTLATLAAVLVVLVLELLAADVALLAALAVLMLAEVVPVQQALGGFASETLPTLAGLYVVAEALRRTGALARASAVLLSTASATWRRMLRLTVPVAVGSAFLNNTPIVAMGIPALQSWCDEVGERPSRYLMPLSYASILGGMCTLMGTSTNLIAHGMLLDRDLPGLGFFELAWVGVPCGVVGLAFLAFVSPRLMRDVDAVHAEDVDRPDDDDAPEPTEGAREAHTVAVREDSRLVGRTVEEARVYDRFRAIVSEVRRRGEAVSGDVSDTTLRAGDTLVLDTDAGFRRAFGDAQEFVITTGYEPDEPDEQPDLDRRRRRQTAATVVVLLAIVGLSATGTVPISVAALAGAVLLIAGGVVSAAQARDAIDWQVLVVVGAALGLGDAMEASGTADVLGDAIVRAGQAGGPVGLLAAVLLGTSVLTQLLTNNGAVALFFPVALSAAQAMDVDPRPLVVGLTAAGSMAFLTPLGYQTNLMVHSAGDYRFLDFVRVGGPLQLVLLILCTALIPALWPF